MARAPSPAGLIRGLFLDLLLLVTSWAYVFLAPYSKVEESFNLHATHDVLMYGVGSESLLKYDHKIFPGAVPRTFVGSILLGCLTKPVASLGTSLGLVKSKMDLQITLRLVLASLNSFCLILIRHAVSKRFGRLTSWLFALLTLSQFHFLFWMSRTLPNMFALIPVNLAFFTLYNRAPQSIHPSRASVDITVGLLVFTAVIFRSEVALLLGPLSLQFLIQGHTTFARLIKVGLSTGIASIALTVVVDSYFWNQWPLWPELYGFYFNVYLGKSAEWGTSAPLSYFSAHLPKLLLGALPLAVLGSILDHRIRSLLLAPFLFVLGLSALKHKEWRFVVYVIPLVNIAAARGARWMVSQKKGLVFRYMAFLSVFSILSLDFVMTTFFASASIMNYPGGLALATFNKRYAGQENGEYHLNCLEVRGFHVAVVHVHISNLAAQTGASLFLHEHAPPYILTGFGPAVGHDWIYNKTEGLTPPMLTSSNFTHLISEYPDLGDREWSVVDQIPSFKRWRLNEKVVTALKRGKPWDISLGEWIEFLHMEKVEELWILERTSWKSTHP
ncbi:glycosyltransferase family 22 protein [Pisolithus croceorrhizus]|nr:glycosyltransferase family 22 protein [Pisolithus croceorrhizus]KAI6168200.1 glycosyltransferase family 22 protein [Pisolithus thermaeus]